MILDTSALAALLFGEAEASTFLDLLLEAPRVRISAASYLECAIVVDRVGDSTLSHRLDELLLELKVEVADVTVEHARAARVAYRSFGKGTGHPAGLNYGDCFSYALALTADDALLFKGDDFLHTDVRPAWRSPAE